MQEKWQLFLQGKKKWLYSVLVAGLLVGLVIFDNRPEDAACIVETPEAQADKVSGTKYQALVGSERVQKKSGLKDPFCQKAEPVAEENAGPIKAPLAAGKLADKPVIFAGRRIVAGSVYPVLTGVFHVGVQGAALLDFSGKTVMVREGEAFGGWTVLSVGAASVQISDGLQETALYLGTGRKKEKVATIK